MSALSTERKYGGLRTSWVGGTNSRFVLRMWVTDFDVRNGHLTELWIGSVVEERLANRFPLFTVTQAVLVPAACKVQLEAVENR